MASVVVQGKSENNREAQNLQFFAFFESFDSQKLPKMAQKVDLRLRDVHPNRNESKKGSGCGGKSVERGREVG